MLDDHALITAARGGDQLAYAALYRRHHRRAVQEARKVVRNNADAEDNVAAAFASTFLAIRKGGGPDVSFRAYLMTAVRNAALQLVRTKRFASEVVTEAPASAMVHMDVYQVGGDPAVREAFQNLPSRWQQVLWKTEIEGLPPRVLTAEMEMSAASIAALAKRARDGFRTAYLTSAVGSDPHPWAVERLDLLREGALDPRTRDLVELHVEDCGRCQDIFAPVAAPISAASLGVILLIGGAIAPVGGIGGAAAGGATGAWLRHVRSRTLGRMSARVATLSAVSVAVVGTVLVVGVSARLESTARSTTTTSISAPAAVGLPPATGGSPGSGAGGPASGGPVAGGTDRRPSAPGASGTAVDASGAAVGTGRDSSTSIATVDGDSTSEGVAGGPATASTTASDATVRSASGSTSTSAPSTSSTTVRSSTTTARPSISVGAPSPSTGTTVEPRPGAGVTLPPPAGAAVPTIAPATTVGDVAATPLPTTPFPTTPFPTTPSSTAPATTTAATTTPSTEPMTTTTAPPPTAPTTTTSRAPPPDYRGTVSFLPIGGSAAIASILAIGSDGLPAGTTLQFTASSIDPSWTVSFRNIRNCPDLPTSLPPGDNVNSLAVTCTTSALALGGLASITVDVVDQTCSGTADGVLVVVVAQRPGALPSNPLRLTLGCR